MTEIQKWLYEHQDKEYGAFNSKLVPNIDKTKFIGVRTPELRAYAKQLIAENRTAELLDHLPHTFFEENQLHAFILSEMKDYDGLIRELERFLPYIDNWATCDQLRPRIFKKHSDDLRESVSKWLDSQETYTIRFGLGMLLTYFLDDKFKEEDIARTAEIKSSEYYVNIMLAWYYATALAKQWDAMFPYLEGKKLSPWIHKKTIQKAVESRRINDSQKEILRALRG